MLLGTMTVCKIIIVVQILLTRECIIKNKYKDDPFDSEKNLGQPLFHSFINYESILWLDGYNYYDYKEPKIIPGFIQFSELIQFNACKGFEHSTLIYKFTDNLIEQCTLIILWLVPTTEVFNGLNCT